MTDLSLPEHSLQCSVTCGQGRTTRQVLCVDYSDHVIDRSQCDTDYIPETAQDCSLPPCSRQTPDRGLAQHPFQNAGYHPRSLGPSQTHVLGGNQWRTGPWGAVSMTESFPNLPSSLTGGSVGVQWGMD